MPDPKLEAAYRATDYHVTGAPNGRFVIRVGEMCVDLEELLFDEVEFDWAYLTACNPGSVRLTAEENDRRTAELREVLNSRWPRRYEGFSAASDGAWQEPSFLVLGIDEAEAVGLGRRFGQNAIVAGRVGEPARLVWVE